MEEKKKITAITTEIDGDAYIVPQDSRVLTRKYRLGIRIDVDPQKHEWVVIETQTLEGDPTKYSRICQDPEVIGALLDLKNRRT